MAKYADISIVQSIMNDNNTTQTKKKKRPTPNANILESLKDLGSGANDLFSEGAKDAMSQILGTPQIRPIDRSGEIGAGESVAMNDIVSGQHEAESKLRGQLALERRLRTEEKEIRNSKVGQLQLQLNALIEELQAVASTTQNLAEATQIAAMSAPVEPGVYHLLFFEKLLSFLKSYRKKVEEAATWLNATNKRANKKNYWDHYKKHGSKFLLSPEHYLARSAG